MRDLTYVLDLQFFSAESEGRTEKATSKKREDAREKGQVAKSKDLETAVLIVTFCIAMALLGSSMLEAIKEYLIANIEHIGQLAHYTSDQAITSILTEGILALLKISLPIWGILMVIAFIICFIQVRYKFTLQPMKPKFSKMNPLNGLKRIISKDTVITLVLAMAKVSVLGMIAITIIKGKIPTFLLLYQLPLTVSLKFIGNAVLELGYWVGGAFLVLSLLDYVYQRYKHEESIKMTKQEIKEEYKNAEGDPQIKSKIKQKMRAASMQRMMQSIPEADVIITNPTHFAVAIQYDEAKGMAPVVVAKGVDYVAKQIKEKAKEHQIEIVENRPLARALYYTVEVNKEIPPELYSAVAEVLAFVYNLQNKK